MPSAPSASYGSPGSNLHDFIVSDPQFRENTATKSEVQIQTEIRPLILRYLEEHFCAQGYGRVLSSGKRGSVEVSVSFASSHSAPWPVPGP